MEASVKERLTGALIFVAAVIIIVPEMFSGPEPQPDAIAPAQSANAGPPVRTVTMTLNDAGETRAPAPAPAAPEALPIQPAAAPQAVAAEPQPVAVAPEAVTTKPEVSEGVTTAGGNWWLQVGIFSVRDNAEGLAQKLRAAGFAIDMDKQAIGGKQMYRVRAGPARDRAEVVALQARLKASGNDSRILPP